MNQTFKTQIIKYQSPLQQDLLQLGFKLAQIILTYSTINVHQNHSSYPKFWKR